MTIGRKLHLVCALSCALAAACSSEATSPGGGGAEGAKAQLRIAHLATDAPSVDVCLLSDDGNVGPIAHTLLGEPGIAYGQVTGYVAVPAGTYTARVVQAGSVVCELPIQGIPDIRNVTIGADARYTLAALGQVTANPLAAYTIKAFPDDTTAESTRAKLRFIHAVPAFKSVDVGLGAGATFKPLFTSVGFGEAGKADDKTYAELAPLSGETLTVRKTGSSDDIASLPGLSLRAGQVATIFAIGDPGVALRPVSALVCTDVDGARAKLSACTHLTP